MHEEIFLIEVIVLNMFYSLSLDRSLPPSLFFNPLFQSHSILPFFTLLLVLRTWLTNPPDFPSFALPSYLLLSLALSFLSPSTPPPSVLPSPFHPTANSQTPPLSLSLSLSHYFLSLFSLYLNLSPTTSSLLRIVLSTGQYSDQDGGELQLCRKHM